MKLRISLIGAGGDLDTHEIDISDDNIAEISERIHDAFSDWILAPGDTITIVEID